MCFFDDFGEVIPKQLAADGLRRIGQFCEISGIDLKAEKPKLGQKVLFLRIVLFPVHQMPFPGTNAFFPVHQMPFPGTSPNHEWYPTERENAFFPVRQMPLSRYRCLFPGTSNAFSPVHRLTTSSIQLKEQIPFPGTSYLFPGTSYKHE